MRALRLVAVFMLLAVTVALAQTADGALKALQGRWVVIGGEHNGKPMDAIKNGVMTITGNAFEIRTASGNALKGTLRVDSSRAPWQMDLTHADGTRWEAIFEVQGDTFRLNYVDMPGKDPRPSAFTTTEKTEESVVSLRREAK
jgi:uncharacterized protein (TIGR03067 family)